MFCKSCQDWRLQDWRLWSCLNKKIYKTLAILLGWLLCLQSIPLWAETALVWQEEQQQTRQARVMLAVEEETSLSSQIDGRIHTIMVREGERIKRGQTLVTMDCAIQQAHKKKAQAEVNAASHALEAQKRLVRLRSGSIMQTNLAVANLAKAKAGLEIINVTLAMCRIKAPFNGLLVKRLAHTQQYLAKGLPILDIIDDSTIHAHLIVPSIWLLWLQPGSPFSFRLDETGLTYQATVSHIGVRVDAASQTLLIKGAIEGTHQELKVGMGGMAIFPPSSPPISNGPSPKGPSPKGLASSP